MLEHKEHLKMEGHEIVAKQLKERVSQTCAVSCNSAERKIWWRLKRLNTTKNSHHPTKTDHTRNLKQTCMILSALLNIQ
jgi:hypothetical protein